MKNSKELTKLAIDLLTSAVLTQKRVIVTDTNHIISTYDDCSGQRAAYLSFLATLLME